MKRFSLSLLIVLIVATAGFATTVRPKGTTRFQTLSAQKQPLPSMELDAEFNNVVSAINGMSLNQNSSEWYDSNYAATYISTTQFSVSGDKTAEFLATRRIKIDVTGTSVYSEIASSAYSSGPNATTVTIADAVLQNPIIKVYYSVVKPIGQNGSVTAKLITGYPVSTGTTANTIPVRDGNGKIPGNITGDAATLAGYPPTTASLPNTIVQRNAAGEIVGTITGGSTTLGGYPADTGTTGLTVPVRDASGKLPGDVLGNSATATNATTHIAAATGAEHGATSTNTANMIVRRDASGNFSAGTITGSFVGNVTGNVTGNATTATTAANVTKAVIDGLGIAASTATTAANVTKAVIDNLNINADMLDGYHYTAFSTPASVSTSITNAINDYHSHGDSGYQTLPSGLMLQWGTFTIPGTDWQTTTFPVSFTTAVYNITVSAQTPNDSSTVAAMYPPTVRSKTKTGFELGIYGTGVTGWKISWFAIGK